MSAFTQGLHFGFAQGMFNNMFGFGGFGRFWGNPFGCCCMPSFFNMSSLFMVPRFNFTNFYTYPTIMPQVNLPVQTYNMSSLDFSAPKIQMLNNIQVQTPVIGTQNYTAIGDTFIKEKVNEEERKTEIEEQHPMETISAKALEEKWSKKGVSLTKEFYEKVVQISENIKCNPEDIMAIMYHESRFNPKAMNKENKKLNVGLIQFGADARHDLRVPGADNSNNSKYDYEKTAEAMLKMSLMEQLVYVEKYFIRAKKNVGFADDEVLSTGTLAALAFQPSNAKKEVLASIGSDAYKNNASLDKNGDGDITKTELANRINSYKA